MVSSYMACFNMGTRDGRRRLYEPLRCSPRLTVKAFTPRSAVKAISQRPNISQNYPTATTDAPPAGFGERNRSSSPATGQRVYNRVFRSPRPALACCFKRSSPMSRLQPDTPLALCILPASTPACVANVSIKPNLTGLLSHAALSTAAPSEPQRAAGLLGLNDDRWSDVGTGSPNIGSYLTEPGSQRVNQ